MSKIWIAITEWDLRDIVRAAMKILRRRRQPDPPDARRLIDPMRWGNNRAGNLVFVGQPRQGGWVFVSMN